MQVRYHVFPFFYNKQCISKKIIVGLTLSFINFCRLDRVYYAQPVEGSTNHHEENQATVLKFLATSIDKRSIPGEQVESKAKEALDVIKKYLNDDTKKV